MNMVQLPVMVGLLVLAQTAALFYWGGKIHQMLKDHERRITRVENRTEEREV